jgi:hypothetical protein
MPERTRAEFEGILHYPGKQVVARGPFTVEVFSAVEGGYAGRTVFRARIVGAGEFNETFETTKTKHGKEFIQRTTSPMQRSHMMETQKLVEFRFEKKIRDWYDPDEQQDETARDSETKRARGSARAKA